MKAIVQHRYGNAEVLQIDDVEIPSPGPGEVLINVAAASLNPLDWHMMTGTPYLVRLVAGLRRPKQKTRGADVAGVVAAVGDASTGFSVGDRVFGIARGSLAEQTIAPAGVLARTPPVLSDAEAAALPVAATTALQAVREHAAVQPGHRVLIIGAAGGVGTAAVQLAVAAGGIVTGVCSGRNVEMVRALGASRVVDYTTDDFVDDQFVVDGGRYDAIIDNVGNRTLSDCRQVLAVDGIYVMISGPKSNKWLDPMRRMALGKVRFMVGSQRFANFTAEESTERLVQLCELIEAGQLRSVIDRHITLADVPAALDEVGRGHVPAKIIVAVAVAVDVDSGLGERSR